MTKKEEVKAAGGPVRHAFTYLNKICCLVCSAYAGDPCRGPDSKPTLPHKWRWIEYKKGTK